MLQAVSIIRTKRLVLCPLADRHRSPFAQMHADDEVMADLGGAIDTRESDAKFDRYLHALSEHGVARFAVEDQDRNFLGYAGVMPRMSADHPLGPHHEVGWRFRRHVWGHGYATESTRAALHHAIHDVGLKEILAYASGDNTRSQGVMRKLAFIRDPSRDFSMPITSTILWHGLVWTVPPDVSRLAPVT